MNHVFTFRPKERLREDTVARGSYRMIDTVQITNFRCFESIHLSDCRRINLIVGENASGKTALLEAIFLASGATPELTLKVRAWRGQELISVAPDRGAYEAIWKDLFHELDPKKAVTIEFGGSGGAGRSLRIMYDKTDVVIPFGGDARRLGAAITPIIFSYRDEAGKEYRVSPMVSPRGLEIPIAELPPLKGIFFTTQSFFNQQQFAGYFSSLSIRKKHAKVVETLRKEFPFVQDVSVEVGSGDVPMLYTSVAEVPEKIPITLLSAGVAKLLCILLAIASCAKGIVLIDEMENGFFYNTLPSIWSRVFDFASEYDVQVFASTHSRECLQGLVGALQGREEDVSLIRTVVENGTHAVEQFDGKTFIAALRQHGEVR